MHQATPRKRVVSSCMPCYTKKQKCNRKFPCNQCLRRRRPEHCLYQYSQYTEGQSSTEHPEQNGLQTPSSSVDGQSRAQLIVPSSLSTSSTEGQSPSSEPRLLESLDIRKLKDSFSYSEEIPFSTPSLIQKMGLSSDETSGDGVAITDETVAEVHTLLSRIPSRPIIDFLIQYFVAEINWREQVSYVPHLLNQYEQWWDADKTSSTSHIDFAILLLRIGSYTSLFLPSPVYTLDSIRGVPLTQIRATCDQVADGLLSICNRLDTRGSLLRVQHLAVAGLSALCQGRSNDFRKNLGDAINQAQCIGIHKDGVRKPPVKDMGEMQREMRKRLWCNLYLWDSMIARRMNRLESLPRDSFLDNMPRMRFVFDCDYDPDAPDLFTERVLEAKLEAFWRGVVVSPPESQKCIITAAQDHYELFCKEFLPTLPPAFALQPDKRWDARLTKVPMQRQLLHVALFECLLHNFRPVLFLEPSHLAQVPRYKRILLLSHKKSVAITAIRVLEGVEALHSMVGGDGGTTQFPTIISPTFEAAVSLIYLCTDSRFPEDDDSGSGGEHGSFSAFTINIDSTLGLESGTMGVLTREGCVNAITKALSRLQKLSDMNYMAETGARALSYIWNNVAASGERAMSSSSAQTMAEFVQASREGMVGGLQTPAESAMDANSFVEALNFIQPMTAGSIWDDLISGDTSDTSIGLNGWSKP